MTVKEVKDKLDGFPDNYIVLVPRDDGFGYTEVTNVSVGFNEMDRYVLIDDYGD